MLHSDFSIWPRRDYWGRKRLLLHHSWIRTNAGPQTCLLFGALTWWATRYSWGHVGEQVSCVSFSVTSKEVNVVLKNDQRMWQAAGNLCAALQTHFPPPLLSSPRLAHSVPAVTPSRITTGQVQWDKENKQNVNPCLIDETLNRCSPCQPSKVKTKGCFGSVSIRWTWLC